MSGDQPRVRPDGLGNEPVAPPATEVPPSAQATTAAATAPVAAAESAVAVHAAESAVAPPEATAAPSEAAVPATAAAATADLSVARRRGLALVAGIGRILRFALVVALFAIGIVLGNQAFLNSQSAATRSAADPATAGKQPAPVVREFIAAVGTNDADRIRSAVPAEPYKLFTSEIERWNFQQVTSVETLSTYEDGPRAATAFVMLGLDTNGNPIAMDLIVETQDGNIVGFK
jgi:hypothetical protein